MSVRSYARKHQVANAAVTRGEHEQEARGTARPWLQSVPGRTTSRAARTPQSIGLPCATTRIQCGICARAISVVETNSSGSPMKFASAIIVASRRVRSAIPCESPAKALFTRIAARMTITQPATPACTRTPSATATTRMITAWIAAVSAERTICERMIARAGSPGVARKRSTNLWSRSLIIPIPLQVAPKNEFMTTIAGARNVTYEVVPKPPRCVALWNSWP